LKSILEKPVINSTVFSASQKELTLEIIEKTTGINASNLQQLNYKTIITSWTIPEGDIEPDEWLTKSLDQLSRLLWTRLEVSHRLTIDLMLLFAMNNSKYSELLNFKLGETRKYEGGIVDENLGVVTLTSANDYDIGYSQELTSRTFIIEAKTEGFTNSQEIELLAQMSIIYATRVEEGKESPKVYGALATKNSWKFYIIQDNGYAYKTNEEFLFEKGKLSRVLFVLDYILSEMVEKSPSVSRSNTNEFSKESEPVTELVTQLESTRF
jgi:hypothetical protein